MMCKKVDELIEQNLPEAIAALQALIKIPSIKADPLPNMPFGKPIAEALENVLTLSEKLGFEARNVDGYVGVADYGTGEETLGVFCHIDVVPEGLGGHIHHTEQKSMMAVSMDEVPWIIRGLPFVRSMRWLPSKKQNTAKPTRTGTLWL